MMRVRTLTNCQEIEDVEEGWLRLWLQAPRPEVFMHHAWVRQILKVYGVQKGLHCMVVEDADGVLRGVLPLIRDFSGKLRFIGDPRSDYSDVLCAPDDGPSVVRLIIEALGSPRVLRLHAVPENSSLMAALRKTDWRHRLTLDFEEACPAIEFDEDGLVVQTLLKKDSLRRHEKKVAKLGTLSLRKLETQNDALAALPVLFDQHVARWRKTASPSLFENEDHRQFYEQLVRDEVMWTMVDFRLLLAGDRVVATHFGFFAMKRFLWYKPTFDPEIAELGPGEVLLKHLIGAAAAEGASEFDFTRGNEGFKQRFANVTRSNFLIHSPGPIERLRSIARSVRDRIKKKV